MKTLQNPNSTLYFVIETISQLNGAYTVNMLIDVMSVLFSFCYSKLKILIII